MPKYQYETGRYVDGSYTPWSGDIKPEDRFEKAPLVYLYRGVWYIGNKPVSRNNQLFYNNGKPKSSGDIQRLAAKLAWEYTGRKPIKADANTVGRIQSLVTNFLNGIPNLGANNGTSGRVGGSTRTRRQVATRKPTTPSYYTDLDLALNVYGFGTRDEVFDKLGMSTEARNKIQSVKDLQDYLNLNYLNNSTLPGNLPGTRPNALISDNKFGKLTKGGLLFAIDALKAISANDLYQLTIYPPKEDPLNYPLVPEQKLPALYYNRRDTRRWMRENGLNPYDFSGKFRRNLRHSLNRPYYDEWTLLVYNNAMNELSLQLNNLWSYNPSTQQSSSDLQQMLQLNHLLFLKITDLLNRMGVLNRTVKSFGSGNKLSWKRRFHIPTDLEYTIVPGYWNSNVPGNNQEGSMFIGNNDGNVYFRPRGTRQLNLLLNTDLLNTINDIYNEEDTHGFEWDKERYYLMPKKLESWRPTSLERLQDPSALNSNMDNWTSSQLDEINNKTISLPVLLELTVNTNNNFSRKDVRQYLRDKGINPYSVSAAQRKFIRQLMNSGINFMKKGNKVKRNSEDDRTLLMQTGFRP